LADIHSNLEAFRVCLEAAGEVDGYISPGDLVGYGPNPNECIELVKANKFTCIGGNHDLACVERIDASWFAREAKEAIEWTSRQLNEKSREFLGSLEEHLQIENYEIVHGSLRNHMEEYITNIQDGKATIELMKKDICFVGHLHIPLVIVREKDGRYDGWQLNDGDVVDVSKFDKAVINVGAVGQPRDFDKRASFGIYDTEAKTVGIRKVEYNISAVQEKMRKADLPDFLIERLKYGR